jgi:hypothetical protein
MVDDQARRHSGVLGDGPDGRAFETVTGKPVEGRVSYTGHRGQIEIGH